MNRAEPPANGLRAPRYARLADTLRARITAGDYAVGAFLPTEAELCEEFAVSRHTVREALRRLAEAGYLRRRQGSGSEVVARRPQDHYVHAMRSLDGLFQYAADTRFRILRMGLEVPGPAHADDLRGAQEAPWLVIDALRSEVPDGRPICASTVFVNADFAAIAEVLPGHRGAIYPLIEARFGAVVAEVAQEIRCLPMPPGAGRALGVPRKAWAARVLRRYTAADGRLLLASVNYHPADSFAYSMVLQRDGGRERG